MGFFKESIPGKALKMSELFERARFVCGQLNEWGERFMGTEEPEATLHVSQYVLAIEFGGLLLWSNQENDEDQLNLTYMQREFKLKINALASYPAE